MDWVPVFSLTQPGWDDEGDLGALRIRQTLKAMERTDIARTGMPDEQIGPEMEWAGQLKEKNIPTIWVLNQADKLEDPLATARAIEKKCGQVPLIASALNRQGMDDILRTLVHKLPDASMEKGIVGHLVSEGDTVLLVMPQDIRPPKAA